MDKQSSPDAVPDKAGPHCPLCKGYDRTPAAQQARAEALRKTIPVEVAAMFRGMPVTEMTLCAGRYMVKTVRPEPPVTLDEAVYWLSNGHPSGLASAHLTFAGGGHIRFASMAFLSFAPAPAGNDANLTPT